VTKSVSVIIPTYGRSDVIGRAIASVRAQTFTDWELIVVNDGPEDGTQNVVAEFDDPRIRYFCHTQNRGGSAARNTGLRAAETEYIAFLDSDDEWLPHKLEQQMAIVNHDSAIKVASCGCILIENDGVKTKLVPSTTLMGYSNVHRLEEPFIMTTGALLCSRDLLNELRGFDETLPAFQDWDLCLRISRVAAIHCVRKPLLLIHNTSRVARIGTDGCRLTAALELVLSKYRSEFDSDAVAKAKWLQLGGDRCFVAGDYSAGRSYYRRAATLLPLPFHKRTHYYLSFWPAAYIVILRFWRAIFWGLRRTFTCDA
jgi:glycosyltransferase involved in cell wall biosynthesis